MSKTENKSMKGEYAKKADEYYAKADRYYAKKMDASRSMDQGLQNNLKGNLSPAANVDYDFKRCVVGGMVQKVGEPK